MDDIERKLKSLDEVPAPNLWETAHEHVTELERGVHGLSGLRRSAAILVAFVVFSAAAFLGWSAFRPRVSSERPGDSSPAGEVSPMPGGNAARIAELVCAADGPKVVTPVVELQQDGLHVHVRNETSASVVFARDPQNVGRNWAMELQSDPVADFVVRYEPGEFVIGCFSANYSDLHEIPLTNFAPISVVDPHGYWGLIRDEDTCGEPLPPPVPTANQPAPLAGPLTGRLLVEAWSDTDRGDILSVDADGSDVQGIFVGPGENWDPTWSPDRSMIAFVSSQDRYDDGEIFVMNADGTGLVQLTDNDATDDLLTWSPDGTRLLFRSNRDGIHGLYVMNSDGSDQHALPIPGDAADSSAWSPNGSRIAFVGTPGSAEEPGGCPADHELFVMDADGSNLVLLTDDELYEQRPAWSPDGSQIAFMASNQDDYRWDVFVINSDGTGLRRLTDHPGYDGKPVWSTDGTMIAFSSDRGATAEEIADDVAHDSLVPGATPYVMNADGSGTQPLLDVQAIFGASVHEAFVVEWQVS